MTDKTHTANAPRRAKSGGFAWKSGLVASSVGVVLAGWVWMAQAEAPVDVTAQSAPPPRVIVVQVPVYAGPPVQTPQFVRQPAALAQVQQAQQVEQVAAAPAFNVQPVAARPSVSLPAMPQKPVFQQPVTRTRGS